MLASDVSINQLAQMGIDTFAAEEELATLPAGDPKVQNASRLFESYRTSVEIMVGQALNLVDAKEAANSIVVNSDELMSKSQTLVNSYQLTMVSRISGVVALLSAVLTLLLLLLISK